MGEDEEGKVERGGSSKKKKWMHYKQRCAGSRGDE